MLGGGIDSHKLNIKNQNINIFEEIISLENLFLAWKEFSHGKKNKSDIQQFEFNLEDNIFQLHRELKLKFYRHSHYTAFNVCDPKLRRIHKATVKDRILHHAVFRILYPIFDKNFIFDSYSCRIEKGTHRGVLRLEEFCRKLNGNNHKNIFALKCDIKKFFDSIDQGILLKLIEKKIKDKNTIWLVKKIIKSFPIGLPLGNVTSQLFANIYLNELDQFAKHKLKSKYYLRYCDDFLILGKDSEYLQSLIPIIDDFLQRNLKLILHPDKIIIRKYRQGIDFLGYVALPYHKVLRMKTKKRIIKKIILKKRELKNRLISKKSFDQSLQSYYGVLKHCKGQGIKKKIYRLIRGI
ncbi:group II intron-encoded protein LtrA [bacterium BMS3Abin15]|nr:group II intron-encoded protein LtrA [bacterium BMS3Abin15]